MRKRAITLLVAAVTVLSVISIEYDALSASGPDLALRSVSNPPESIERGAAFSVTDTLTNKGSSSSKKSVIQYYLSLDKKKNSGDKLLTGRRTVSSLKPRKSIKGTTQLTVPPATPLGGYYLLACADDTKRVKESSEKNNCVASKKTIQITDPSFSVSMPASNDLKGIQTTAGLPQEVKFVYDLPPDKVMTYDTISLDLQEILNSGTVSIAPRLTMNNIMKFLAFFTSRASASATVDMSVRIGDSVDTVCEQGFLYGPYTIIGTLSSQTIQPSTVSASPSNISIINTGSFAMCFQFTPPVDVTVNVNDVQAKVTTCDREPVNMKGTWKGIYTCINSTGVNDIKQPISLTITQNGKKAHYTDGSAEYDGHVCGNVFKFNGGVPGSYTESGTFIMHGDGTATKTSKWFSESDPLSIYGNCRDNLHK